MSPIVGMMIQSDELIFFREVGIPPISQLVIIKIINFHEIHPFGRNKCAYFCFHLPQARSVHRTSLSSPVEKNKEMSRIPLKFTRGSVVQNASKCQKTHILHIFILLIYYYITILLYYLISYFDIILLYY